MSWVLPTSSRSFIRLQDDKPRDAVRQWLRWLTAGCCVLLCACSGLPAQHDYAGLSLAPARELSATPFFPQVDYQCGPAALAGVLNAQGAAVSPAELTPLVYIPARKGSLQVEMLTTPARYGRLGVRTQPSMAALLQLLSAGQPVVVLQNFGLASHPVWHYAVAIGYSLEPPRIILRSGTRERVSYPFRVFRKTWSRAAFWGMVVLQPGQIPAAGVVLDDYLPAVTALERQGRYALAGQAYHAATRRWPDSALAWSGAGNSAYAQAQPAAAAVAYRRALALDPSNRLIMNNLALALAQQGCVQQAQGVLACARRGNFSAAVLAETANEIRQFADTGGNCQAFSCPLAPE